MDYQVDLDVFHGPLDLLLYLVQRDEVDVRDVRVARIAEQFKDYLEVMPLIDVETAGDFLVMASTLAEIKSRMLLPRAEEEGGEADDPRMELVRQLLEYKKFKDAAKALEEQADEQGRKLARQPVPTDPTPNQPPPVRQVELWDLVSAFGRLLRETMATAPQTIAVDQTPLHVYTEQIVERLRREGRLTLRELFTPPHNRGRLVGLFLAILELTKTRRVVPDQPGPFDDIGLSLSHKSEIPTPKSETADPEPETA